MSEQSPFPSTTATLMPLPEASDALPVGTQLGEFEIKEVIGTGGFGIVYRAWEPALEREVALKEYMPMGMVGRDGEGRVTLRSRSYEEDYALGLNSFVNEARLLARFDHPALVKVHRFWEANGTAYMAMPFYKAQTLRQRRQELGAQPPTQAWLMSMIEPLLGALAEMHRVDVYHRDIAPDNILWCTDSRPVLLDFGAARHVLADRTQHLTAVLKPHFAPIEQYADAQSMRQGPWTDVFALASTCYFMLTGRPPLPATARVLCDDLRPLAELAPPGFSAQVLDALDWAMAVRPRDRPQSVATLWDALHGHVKVPERVVDPQAAVERSTIPTGDYEKTIQTTATAKDAEPAGRVDERHTAAPRTTAGTSGYAKTIHTTPNATGHSKWDGTTATRRSVLPPAMKLRAAAGQVKRHQWLLVVLAVVAGGACAWFALRDDGRAPTEAAATHDPSAGPTPVVAPASAIAVRGAPTADGQAASAAAASAPVRSGAASPAIASRAPGLREMCPARSSNAEACIRRVCKSEPRFRHLDTCLRLQRPAQPPPPAQPWWHIFKPG